MKPNNKRALSNYQRKVHDRLAAIERGHDMRKVDRKNEQAERETYRTEVREYVRAMQTRHKVLYLFFSVTLMIQAAVIIFLTVK